jgi:hypothetical protein
LIYNILAVFQTDTGQQGADDFYFLLSPNSYCPVFYSVKLRRGVNVPVKLLGCIKAQYIFALKDPSVTLITSIEPLFIIFPAKVPLTSVFVIEEMVIVN